MAAIVVQRADQLCGRSVEELLAGLELEPTFDHLKVVCPFCPKMIGGHRKRDTPPPAGQHTTRPADLQGGPHQLQGHGAHCAAQRRAPARMRTLSLPAHKLRVMEARRPLTALARVRVSTVLEVRPSAAGHMSCATIRVYRGADLVETIAAGPDVTASVVLDIVALPDGGTGPFSALKQQVTNFEYLGDTVVPSGDYQVVDVAVAPARAAAATPAPVVATFLANLKKFAPHLDETSAGFQAMLRTIFLKFNPLLLQAYESPRLAWVLYEHVSSMPHTSTKRRVEEQCRLTVGGPLSATKPCLLVASGPNGEQLVVKVLKAARDRAARSLDEELAFEAHVAAHFGAMKESAFLPTQAQAIQLADDVQCHCLVMPRLATTLAHSAQVPLRVLLQQGQRIHAALQVMHAEGKVHADVKGDNIFIDQPGRWYLGDFGSCTNVGAAITSSTPTYYPRPLVGAAAHPSQDLFMLGLTLLVAASMRDDEWKSLFSEDVPPDRVPSRLRMEERLQRMEAASAEQPQPQHQLASFIRELVCFDQHFAGHGQ